MNNVALVVGVDRYWTSSAHLRGAVGDAIDFATWLITEASVPPHQLRLALARHDGSPVTPDLLRGDVYETDARADDMFDGLEWLVTLSQATKIDRVFVYFSGHGLSIVHPDTSRADIVCTADYSPATGRHAVLLDSIAGRLSAISSSEQFLLIDACRSPKQGGPINGERVAVFGEAAHPAPMQFILKSTARGEKAFEEDRGAFTAALLDSLGGGGRAKARQPDGSYVVRWRRLTEKVAVEVGGRESPIGSGVQAPRVAGETDPLQDPVLAVLPGERVPRATLHIEADPKELPPEACVDTLLSGEFEQVSTNLIGGRAEVSLPQATYLVRARAPGFRSSDPAPVEVDQLDVRHKVELSRLVRPEQMEDATTRSGPMVTRGVSKLRVVCEDPLMRVAIETMDGEAIAADWGALEKRIRVGAYRIRATGPEGLSNVKLLAVSSENMGTERIAPPRSNTPGMQLAINRTGSGTRDVIWPLNSLRWIAAAELSSLVAIRMAQAVIGDNSGHLDVLGVGNHWLSPLAKTGLAVVLVDEREDSERAGAAATVRLHSPTPDKDPRTAALTAPSPEFPQIREADFDAPPGHYDLDLAGLGSDAPGLRVPCTTLEDHVTTLILHLPPTGNGRLLHFCLARRSAYPGSPEMASIHPAEILQRSALADTLTPDHSAIAKLLQDDWFEPIAAAIAIYVLAPLADGMSNGARYLLRNLAVRLRDRAPALPDAQIAASLVLCETPPTCSGIPAIGQGLRHAVLTEKLDPAATSLLSPVASLAVAHRLWTMWSFPSQSGPEPNPF